MFIVNRVYVLGTEDNSDTDFAILTEDNEDFIEP